MNGARFLAHTDPIIYSNGILKIHDIYKINVGLYIYDQLSSGQYAREHDHYTRNRNDLRSVQARLTSANTPSQQQVRIFLIHSLIISVRHLHVIPLKYVVKTIYYLSTKTMKPELLANFLILVKLCKFLIRHNLHFLSGLSHYQVHEF